MDRYDRQVRIWGAQAQAVLENARVVVLGTSFGDPLVQEVVKSLALAGVGGITLVLRESQINGTNCNNGFFLDVSALGGPENNVEVMSWEDFLEKSPPGSIMVTLNLHDSPDILRVCDGRNEPVLSAIASGKDGCVQLVKLGEPHFIMNTHPEYSVPYLWLDNPWPELKEFFESFNLPRLADSGKLAEVPYPVILYHVLMDRPLGDVWDSNNVRQVIDEKFHEQRDYLNVLEARRFAHLALRTASAEHEHIEEALRPVWSEKVNFETWFDPFNHKMSILCRCLKNYLQIYRSLPLSRELPDMESSAELYVRFRSVHKAKQEEDMSKFLDVLHKESGSQNISNTTVREFLSSLNCLGIIHPRGEGSQSRSLSRKGIFSEKKTVHTISPGNLFFFTACFVGGLVSQEIIKLITHQHVPIDDHYTYSGSALGPEHRNNY